MRKWINDDTALMAKWVAEGFDTYPMDASINLGTNKTKVIDMAWSQFLIQRMMCVCEISDLIEIHIFCNVSKLVYGAAAYVKVRKQNEVLINLIASETRVAPLKAVTLPRLELLGALVAA
ncbi:uncharacterized protein TNCV_2077041 [Trichonephila clavipes]|nr:uncharacterized protein TNCV_2077041 [Trichonephila clavipes]